MAQYPIIMLETMDQLKRELLSFSKQHHKALLIVDELVYNQYQGLLTDLIREGLQHILIPSGEQSKSEEVLFKILSYLAQSQFTRKDLLIAFGGGVIGDLTGFAASIYMRGIQWVSVPTTLLSQIDSSVGGKTAINLPEGKNLVGSFYNPAAVCICPLFLASLEEKEFQSGIGEMLKYAYLAELDMLKAIRKLMKLHNTNWRACQSELTSLIDKAIAIKLAIVQKDFKEVHERKFLNLGHSFGHAIEAIEQFELPHGICVAQGLWWIHALDVFEKRPGAEKRLEQYEQLLVDLGLFKPKRYETKALLAFLCRDKKMDGDTIDLIRLNDSAPGMIDYDDEQSIIKQINNQCRIASVSIERLKAAIDQINSLL